MRGILCFYSTQEANICKSASCLSFICLRYGKVRMEEKLKELFGGNMQETGLQGGEITFSEFIQAVEGVQLRTFWKTTKGRIVSSTALGKRSMELTKSL